MNIINFHLPGKPVKLSIHIACNILKIWQIMGCLLLIFVGLGMVITRIAYADHLSWSDPEALINIGIHDEAALAQDKYGHVYALWSTAKNDVPAALFLAIWDRNSWSLPIDVVAQPEGSITWPALAASSEGDLYACWTGINSLTYFSSAVHDQTSTPWGWMPIKPISDQPSMHCDIETDLYGGVHILYAAAGYDVFYTRSEDDGATWSSPVNISLGVANTTMDYPRLAIDSEGGLHAVWTAYSLSTGNAVQGTFYTRSFDKGLTWETPMLITEGSDYAEIDILAVGKSQIHLAWNGRIGFGGRYHQWSNDRGETWSLPEIVIPRDVVGGGKTGPPDMAADSAGAVHLASGMNPGGVMYTFWRNGKWSDPYLIVSPSGWAEKARIVVSEGNRVNILWQSWYTYQYTAAPQNISMPLSSAFIVTPTVMAQEINTPLISISPLPVPVINTASLNSNVLPQSYPFVLALGCSLLLVIIVFAIFFHGLWRRHD